MMVVKGRNAQCALNLFSTPKVVESLANVAQEMIN